MDGDPPKGGGRAVNMKCINMKLVDQIVNIESIKKFIGMRDRRDCKKL